MNPLSIGPGRVHPPTCHPIPLVNAPCLVGGLDLLNLGSTQGHNSNVKWNSKSTFTDLSLGFSCYSKSDVYDMPWASAGKDPFRVWLNSCSRQYIDGIHPPGDY